MYVMECTPWWKYFITFAILMFIINIIEYFIIPFVKWYIRGYKKVKNNKSDPM